MSKKQLQREIAIDVADHDHWDTQDDGTLQFRDVALRHGVDYRRFSRKVERWDYNVRTHVFRIKIPFNKWLTFVAEAFALADDDSMRYQMHRDQQAKAMTFEEYVKDCDYDSDMLDEIRAAFEGLRIYSQNHSVEEYFEKRERLGLVT